MTALASEPDELLATFTLYGDPLPKERPRFAGRRAYTPEKTVLAEQHVIDAFDHACPLWEPTIEYLRIHYAFHRRTRRHVDVDNLIKLVQDALNKVAYRDDEQIASVTADRFYGAKEKARTEVSIYLLGRAA